MATTDEILTAAYTETRRREEILREHGTDTFMGLPRDVAKEDFERIGYEIPIQDVVKSRESGRQLLRLIGPSQNLNIFYRFTGDLK